MPLQLLKTKSGEKVFLTTKPLFTITLIIITLTVTGIWLFGLGQHRTIYKNSLLSTTILSIAFFIFLTIGLYKGVKLKDTLGKIIDKPKLPKRTETGSGVDFSIIDGAELWGEGLGETIIAFIAWVVIAILVVIFIYFFSAYMYMLILAFIAMLYWIFFRALRLVFKNSSRCRQNILRSVAVAFIYTVLYNCWIYGIILTAHYLL